MRAGLDSLRQLANQSARSAIATHHWKKFRLKVAVKFALSVTSLAVGVLLLTGRFWGFGSSIAPGCAATVIGLIVGSELVYSYLKIRKLSAPTGRDS